MSNIPAENVMRYADIRNRASTGDYEREDSCARILGLPRGSTWEPEDNGDNGTRLRTAHTANAVPAALKRAVNETCMPACHSDRKDPSRSFAVSTPCPAAGSARFSMVQPALAP